MAPFCLRLPCIPPPTGRTGAAAAYVVQLWPEGLLEGSVEVDRALEIKAADEQAALLVGRAPEALKRRHLASVLAPVAAPGMRHALVMRQRLATCLSFVDLVNTSYMSCWPHYCRAHPAPAQRRGLLRHPPHPAQGTAKSCGRQGPRVCGAPRRHSPAAACAGGREVDGRGQVGRAMVLLFCSHLWPVHGTTGWGCALL